LRIRRNVFGRSTSQEGGALRVVDSHDRTRIIIALALTLVALPALITANRRSSEERPATVAAVAPVGGATAGGQLAPATDTTTPATPASAPVATAPDAASPAPSAASTTVPVPAPTVTTGAKHSIEGRATFQPYDDTLWGPAACTATGIPIGTVVRITNLNSGLSATCTVRAKFAATLGFVIVTDDSVFSAVADPVVGIIPVRVTW